MKLLAIDPGPSMCGYVVVAANGPRCSYVTGGRIASTPEHVEALLRDVDACAVETPKGYIFQPARGAQLLATARIAGAISWMVIARRMHLVEYSAQEWRKYLCGRANATDLVVEDVVRRNVDGVPARTNAHVRDALGLAVVGAWKLFGMIGERAS